ncbi:hypothetical protein MD484_g7910, partial [Candolleomyces efflorescens]
MSGNITLFYGAVINPQALTSYDVLPRCLLAVGNTGNIDWMVEDVAPHDLQQVLAQHGCSDEYLVELKDGEFLLPGFVDTHTHAPQVPNIGTGQQYELLDWLANVTFPTEAKFQDVDFAKRMYKRVVRTFIDAGTTTCCYYATLHLEASKVLADTVHEYGQRGFIGKCNMNHDSPSYYIEPSVSASISATQSLITYIRSLSRASSPHAALGTPQPLVQPILTPRFAISCTAPLLSSLGELAAGDPELLIQTHISENPSEVEYTNKLFPEAGSYAGVYDQFGLLRRGTILAHAVHLTPPEIDLIKAKEVGISHCPTSNFNLRSGIAPVGKFLDKGVRVGLGTDVSGGFGTSIMGEVRNASIASKVLQFTKAAEASSPPDPEKFENRQLPIPTLLYLATLGGASLCRLESHIGSFAPGKSFDALLISPAGKQIGMWGSGESLHSASEESAQALLAKKELEEWLERFLFVGDDRNIDRVYVQGREGLE